MRVILQRVSQASVTVNGEITGEIGPGILVLAGIARDDTARDADYLADKLTKLRIFPDEAGKMNLSVLDVGGGVLLVSQFTLYGDCVKGRRPSFDRAAPPEDARRLYEHLVEAVRRTGVNVATGIFQADMQVALINSGPVTFMLESK
jgi:D-tyrosyl-tRNA(Tyr) deacylase